MLYPNKMYRLYRKKKCHFLNNLHIFIWEQHSYLANTVFALVNSLIFNEKVCFCFFCNSLKVHVRGASSQRFDFKFLFNLVLLNPDISCLCKQCISRSDLELHCSSFSMRIYSSNLDQVI